MNQALRQELLALVQQDHAFVSAPDDDPNSDQVQRQRLELLGRLRRNAGQLVPCLGGNVRLLRPEREDGCHQ